MTTLTQPYRLLSVRFLQAYVITMRPYLLFLSGITGIAGIALASKIELTTGLLIGLSSFLTYGFGQALTDCFQIDTDCKSSPYRPLTQGLVSRTAIATLSLLGLTACTAVFAMFNETTLTMGCLAGAGLILYTPFKRRWWGGPFYNAWIVCALFLMALGAASGDQIPEFSPKIGWTLVVIFFGYANFVLSGYFKDVDADRATGYETFPVTFGRFSAALLSDLFAATSLLGAFAAVFTDKTTSAPTIAIATLILAVGVSIISQISLHRVQSDANAYRAIALDLSAFGIMLCSIILSQKPTWLPWLSVYAIAYALTMTFRPSREQI